MKDGRPKRGTDRDLALKILALCSAVKDALDDLLETMFIIYQPVDWYGPLNGQASFTVIAANVASYQWQYSEDQGQTWTNTTAEGYNTATMSVRAISDRFRNLYRCILTDADGNVLITNSVKMIRQ